MLKNGAHLIPAEIYVPEIVIDEVENRYREKVYDAIEAHEKATNLLRGLFPEISANLQVSPVIFIEMSDKSQSWLLTSLNSSEQKWSGYASTATSGALPITTPSTARALRRNGGQSIQPRQPPWLPLPTQGRHGCSSTHRPVIDEWVGNRGMTAISSSSRGDL
jgi:hypothetical protein